MTLPSYVLETIEITGSDTLREYRDAVIAELARRDQAEVAPDIVRNNLEVRLEHRAGRQEGQPVTVQSFVLHPRQDWNGNGVMLNRETTRDHLWIEARWL